MNSYLVYLVPVFPLVGVLAFSLLIKAANVAEAASLAVREYPDFIGMGYPSVVSKS